MGSSGRCLQIFRRRNDFVDLLISLIIVVLVSLREGRLWPACVLALLDVHERIRNDSRICPQFKCDIKTNYGTDVSATQPSKDFCRYLGRSGKATQNVMAVVDFYMCFTYASIMHLLVNQDICMTSLFSIMPSKLMKISFQIPLLVILMVINCSFTIKSVYSHYILPFVRKILCCWHWIPK